MQRLRIAVQKSGRLSKDCADLLKDCGVKMHIHEQSLIAFATNLPIDLLRVRDDDIPGLVFDGVVDLAKMSLKKTRLNARNLAKRLNLTCLKSLTLVAVV